MKTLIRPALTLFILFTLLTGIAYPLAITGIAQVVFPSQANGSVIAQAGKPVGSSLIGQEFSDPKYFWGRPSATSPVPYTSFNADKLTGSSGSNLAPTNPTLVDNVKSRIEALNAADKAVGYQRSSNPKSEVRNPTLLIPIDLVTSSGSGLDPHISPAAAEYQVPRIAKARNLSESVVRELVRAHTMQRQLGFLGEPRVNVLELNLALDGHGR